MNTRMMTLTAALCGLLLAGAIHAAEPVLSFTGSDSYVLVGTPTALQIPSNNPFTIEGWMYLHAFSTRDMLYSKNNARTSPYTYMFGFIDSGRMAAYTGSAWVQPSPATAVSLNTWYHLAFSYNGTTMSFYLDGELKGSGAYTFANTTAHTVKLGGYTASSDSNGKMSDVRVWNYARSQEEIEATMGRRLLGDEPGLIGYWPLNEGDGSVVYDQTENASSGTLIGASWTTDDDLVLAPAEILAALPATALTGVSATLNGELAASSHGNADVWAYWDTVDHETNTTWVYSAFLGEQEPGAFAHPVTGLDANTWYYYTFFASNGTIQAWAEPSQAFKTLGPVVVTGTGASDVLKDTAILNGALADGGSAEVWFEWWPADESETNVVTYGWISEGPFAAVVSELTPGSDYVYRTGGSNEYGAVWSAPVGFSTPIVSTYYVSLAGDDTLGGSWATAFTNLQTAIDIASPGDTIYLKGETFYTARESAVMGQFVWTNKALTILGGYAGDGGSPGALTSTPTVLANNSVPTGTPMTNRVFAISGVTNGTLARVTLRNGAVGNTSATQTPYQHYYGGGVHVSASSNLVFDAVVFDGNRVYGQRDRAGHGGALFAADDTYGTLTNCTVRNSQVNTYYNSHNYGAGIHIAGGAWTIRDSVIRDNWMNRDGYNYTGRGLGLYLAGGNHLIRNCAISRNLARGITPQGDAVYVAAGSADIENCTIYWHLQEGIRRAGTAAVTVRDSILWDNGDDIVGTMTLLNNNIEDGDSDGANGNISLDPKFVRGLYLAPDSPCVDAGSRSVGDAGLTGYTTRVDGTPDAGTVNMGYHFAGGAPTYYVSVNDGDDDNAGTHPGDAFKTITRALHTAADGSHIHVAAGTYTADSETFPITVANRYGVQILATNAAETVLALTGTASSRGVEFSYAYPDSRLAGLTITNAYFYHGTAVGAGVYIAHSKVTVESCNVSHNRAHTDSSAGGGWGTVGAAGLYATLSDGVISNCTFRNNRAYATYSHSYSGGGGGVHLNGTWDVLETEISSNEFSLNTAGGTRLVNGGGVYVDGTVLFRNCLIADNWARRSDSNSAYEQGDGVYIWGGDVTFESCTIVTNRSEGIRQAARTLPAVPAMVTLRNSILWQNGDDIWEADASRFTKEHNAIENGDGLGSDGNIQSDPLFVNAAAGDFRLAVGSPCVNAGTNQAWMAGAVDLDANPRIDNDIVDMGCYEQITPLRIVNLPVENVTALSADFRGQLEALGPHEAAHIFIKWGPEDKTTNWTEWAYTEYLGTTNATGIVASNVPFQGTGVTFYYAFVASNDTDVVWGQPSELVLREAVHVIATEPNAAELDQVPGTFTVYRSDAATDVPLTVNFTLTGQAENGVDYELIDPTSVVIGIGQTNATVTITPLIDRWVEGDETVILTLAPGSYVIGSPDTATVTIADWTAPPSLYVHPGGDGTYATNWASAFAGIQDALDNANAGEVIYVAGGTYALDSQITWTGPGVTLVGGYEGSGSPGTQNAETPTILTQSGENRILYLAGVTNAVIANMTITGGLLGHSNPGQLGYDFDTLGAGIYMANCSNVVLNALTIHNNTVYVNNGDSAKGGGIYALDSWGTITNCLIRANLATRGSGTTTRGAGVCIEGGGWDIVDTTIRDHVIPGVPWGNTCQGVGLSLVSGEHTVRNCLITRNLSSGTGTLQGGGVYVGSGNVTLANGTLYWNAPHGIYRNSGDFIVRDSILWENVDDIFGTVTLLHNNIENGDSEGTDGNISVDPKFERGLYLAADSPSVNAGSRAAVEAGLDGRTTQANGVLDAGTVDQGYHFPVGVVDYYVDAVNGLDGNDGLAPASAFKTITRALAVVADGGHVHVATGLYDVANGETFPITVANRYGVQLLGAGAAESVISAAGANARTLSMIHVYPDARVEDLTLKDASWTVGDGVSAMGGGLYVAHCQGAIVGCEISDNRVTGTGNWVAKLGGGGYVTQSRLTVSNCVIQGNTVQSPSQVHAYGGGLAWEGASGLMDSCVVAGNTAIPGTASNARGLGGGVYYGSAGTGSLTMRNCLIITNDARNGPQPGQGSGLYIASAVMVENCTIVSNRVEGIRQAGGTVTVNNSILWGNGMDVLGTLTVNWSNVGESDGTATLNDCISADPSFVDAAAGDYRLNVRGEERSPSVNTGNPVAEDWMLTGVDLDGNPRILNDRVDMGAYENLVPPAGTLFLLR